MYVNPVGFWYNQLLFNESQNREPLAPAPEPESCTEMPPNLTAGLEVLTTIVFVPIFTELPVIFCIDEVPNTIKSPCM